MATFTDASRAMEYFNKKYGFDNGFVKSVGITYEDNDWVLVVTLLERFDSSVYPYDIKDVNIIYKEI
jgi:hypothetical protein